ncbi:cytochrome P450 [Streptomyces sp. NPDC051172]|uniref:cytochrome P450 n=1 Tax=Streptomyces sp. NPDC051172 TaxID=3155796 RepID=UPI0034240FD9
MENLIDASADDRTEPTAEHAALTATGCPYAGAKGPRAAPSVRFDSHEPDLAENPFPTYERLRSVSPMPWSEAWGGFWVALGHEEVTTAARSRALLTGRTLPDGTIQGVTIPPLGQTGRMAPLELDPPLSLKYRKLLTHFYSAGRVRARMPELRELARESLDAVIGSGADSCDIVAALTLRLPAIVTMRDIGLPDDRWFDVDSLLHRALLSAPHDMAAARHYAQLIALEIVEEMEAERDRMELTPDAAPGTGLISHLLRSTVDGEPVPDEDIVSMMYFLLLGIDPTSTLTATALWHLAQHPELRQQLISEPELIPRAADEYLRWMSPVQGTSRTAAEDVVLGERQVRAGERIFLSWAAANRDETVHPDAAHVDLNRPDDRHLAFGGGAHYCLGAGIVRAMFTVMLEEILTLSPDFELADENAITWFPDLSSVYGITSLPLRFPSLRRRA